MQNNNDFISIVFTSIRISEWNLKPFRYIEDEFTDFQKQLIDLKEALNEAIPEQMYQWFNSQKISKMYSSLMQPNKC